MLETSSIKLSPATHQPVLESVLKRIPPLWTLTDYVAVNPFLGYAHRPVTEAAREIADALGASVLPPASYFQKRWGTAFNSSHVARAAARFHTDARPALELVDPANASPERPASQIATFAEQYDSAHGTQWELFLRTSIARYCAVFADQGGQSWHLDLESSLWSVWRECAAADRAPELTGLSGYRQHIAQLPSSAAEAIEAVLAKTDVPLDDLEPYLYRLIGGLFGWASYFRRDNWQTGSAASGPVLDLLAIRLAADAFFAGKGGTPVVAGRNHFEDESARLILQESLEDAYVQTIARNLPTGAAKGTGRDSVQAVFCIDVRSEPLRRHLEALDPSIRTLGFAGFFGVSLAVDGESARCPVLLKPSLRVDVDSADAQWKSSFKKIQSMPASAFSFVEVAGAAYGAKMIKDTCVGDRTTDPETHADFDAPGLDAATKAATAAFILKNMSIGTNLARLVLLCGHQGRSANNPHAAGLDCGACGGHGGAINARVAATILNDRSVRSTLAQNGTIIPDDTRFIAGVHDTSNDVVSILDQEDVPESHAKDLQQLRVWLDQAGKHTRAERAGSLAMPRTESNWLMRLFDRRARHWAEVRPEWALARNAAFIAARRDRTRGLDLAGRSFLHEYDSASDIDASVLTLILSAPMVVASWINLQYFASTVDNDVFGCGNKTIHNRVGRLGVVLGNGGDLRTGLAMQSVHSPGGEWFHEPLRLQVIVEAPREKLDAVLEQQAGVRDLVLNGWVRLFSLDADSNALHLKRTDGTWELVESAT